LRLCEEKRPQCFSGQYYGAAVKYLIIIQVGIFLKIKKIMVHFISSTACNEVIKLAEQGLA